MSDAPPTTNAFESTLPDDADWSTMKALLRDMLSRWKTDGRDVNRVRFRCGQGARMSFVAFLNSLGGTMSDRGPGLFAVVSFHTVPLVTDDSLGHRIIILEEDPR